MLLSHILIGKDIGQTSTEYCKRRNSNGGHLSYASAEKRAIARYLYQICQGHTHFRIDFHHILWHYLIMGGSSGGLAYANVVPNLRAFGSHPRGRGFESLRLHHVRLALKTMEACKASLHSSVRASLPFHARRACRAGHRIWALARRSENAMTDREEV